MRCLFMAIAMVMFGCTPASAPEQSRQADAGSDDTSQAPSSCTLACRNLKELGCPEGESPSCTKACNVLVMLEGVDVSCWTNAETKDDLEECEGIRCIR